MSRTVGKITNQWVKSLNLINQNNIPEAIDALDVCLLILAQATEDGITILDNIKVDLWKTRVWVKLEDLDMIPEFDAHI
jgi:hypothetical protein